MEIMMYINSLDFSVPSPCLCICESWSVQSLENPLPLRSHGISGKLLIPGEWAHSNGDAARGFQGKRVHIFYFGSQVNGVS